MPSNSPLLAEPPIFILGTGRSGTTLVQSLLSAHPRLCVTPETHFCAIWEQRTALPIGHPEEAARFEAGWRGYLASKRFSDLGLSPEAARAILERDDERGPRAALAALMAGYGERCAKPRVGEKTPGHWRWAARLLDWFPEARVILMRRDPRAVAASKMKAPWASRAMRLHGTALRRLTRLHVVAEEARLWRHIHEEAMAPLLADPRVRLVAYEALVADPEGELRGLCDFLGERFEPVMLGPRGEESSPTGSRHDPAWAAWAAEHHAAARRPVDGASLERWRADLSAREVAAMEAEAGEAMERAGYALASTAAERRRASGLARALMAAGEGELLARRAVGALKSVARPRRPAAP